MTVLVAASVVIVFVLAATKVGHDIDAATQRFMLYYAGVFALIGLTGSVVVGLVATDRIVMTPRHRVMAQAVHRAVSFGALGFLIIHIVTEILAQRAHVIDGFIPFLSPYRTFYIGLGTIASDLILLIVMTSILRKRFTTQGRAWRWRAIHYTSYAAFVFGVLHGLLGGRQATLSVDWSYGFAIAVTALGLAVRFLAISLRPKESLSTIPSVDRAKTPGASPLHAAALSMAQAQLGGTVQVLPAGTAARGVTFGVPGTDSWAALPAPRWSTSSDPFPALGAAPAHAVPSSAEAYRHLGHTPLGAPPYGDDVPDDFRGRSHIALDQPRSALAGRAGATGPARAARQPLYEPGYDGPPRFAGAPRGHVPQDELSSYPYGPQGNRPQSGAWSPDGFADREGPDGRTGARPGRPAESSEPRSAPSIQSRRRDRSTGPIPRATTGPMPRAGTGPMPRSGTGPMPRADAGPMPRADSGPMPRLGTGPMPPANTGPIPRAEAGPMPRTDTGPIPRVSTGQAPGAGTGPRPVADRDAQQRADSGPMPRLGTGPMPRGGGGVPPRMGSGPAPPVGTGSTLRADTGPMPRPDTGPMPRPDTGPIPRAGTGSLPRIGPPMPPRVSPTPRAVRPSRRTNSGDPRYREGRGTNGGDER